jgi:hypothetical protein
MRLLTIACVALLGSAPALTEAQTLRHGERIRVALPDTLRQDESRTSRRMILRGSVTRLHADTLFLRPAGTTGELGVVRSQAISLHRSGGVRSRLASAARTSAFMAVGGAAWTGGTYRSVDRDLGIKNRGEAVAVGAIAGAVAGAIVGVFLRTERWTSIPR